MKKIFYILTFLIVIMFGINNVNALGASVNRSSVTVGGNVVVTVDVGGYAGYFSVTSSNSGVLSGGAGNTWMDNESATYTFSANQAGTATIKVRGTAASYATGNDEDYENSWTITVNPKPVVVLSGDNSLSSLGVEGKELSPEFNPDTLEYGVSLEPETTKINVIASASHYGASIDGIGEKDVTDGDNRIEILVTAENGSQQTYVINANVKEYDPVTVKVGNKDFTVVRKKDSVKPLNGYTETTVTIGDNEIPALKSEITGYTLVSIKDESGKQEYYVKDKDTYTLYKEYTFNKIILYPIETKDIPKNYKRTTITYNDEKIVAYKLKDNSKYALIYGMNVETGEKHLYMYDAKEDTLQIYNDEEIKLIKKNNNLYLKIIIGLSILSFGLIIGLIVVLVKKAKKKNIELKHNVEL